MARDGKCTDKPDGVKQTEEDEFATLETLNLEDGFYRLARTSTIVYSCPTPVNCEGGDIGPNETAAALCRKGSVGILCSFWYVPAGAAEARAPNSRRLQVFHARSHFTPVLLRFLPPPNPTATRTISWTSTKGALYVDTN